MNTEPDNLYKIPVSFRVIGYGDDTLPVIAQINALGFDSLEATAVSAPSDMSPTEEDMMAIVIALEKRDGVEALLRTYSEAGVLTLFVSDREWNLPTEICDSQTVVPAGDMALLVKELLDSFLRPGVINFDFNDFSMLLRDSGHFRVLTMRSSGHEDRISDVISQARGALAGHEDGLKRLSLVISVNRDLCPPLKVSEMEPVNEFIHTLRDDIGVVWSYRYDEDLPADTVCLTVIVAG